MTETIENCSQEGGDVWRYNSIAVDATGHVHLAYVDATNSTIKYAMK